MRQLGKSGLLLSRRVCNVNSTVNRTSHDPAEAEYQFCNTVHLFCNIWPGTPTGLICKLSKQKFEYVKDFCCTSRIVHIYFFKTSVTSVLECFLTLTSELHSVSKEKILFWHFLNFQAACLWFSLRLKGPVLHEVTSLGRATDWNQRDMSQIIIKLFCYWVKACRKKKTWGKNWKITDIFPLLPEKKIGFTKLK